MRSNLPLNLKPKDSVLPKQPNDSQKRRQPETSATKKKAEASTGDEGRPVTGCAENLFQELKMIELFEMYRSPYYRRDSVRPMSAYEAARRQASSRRAIVFKPIERHRRLEKVDNMRQELGGQVGSSTPLLVDAMHDGSG